MKKIPLIPFKPTLPEKLPKGRRRAPTPDIMRLMGATHDDAPFFQKNNDLVVCITGATYTEDGKRWVHLSVSRRKFMPSYADLCEVKSIFLGEDQIAYHVFAPKAEHVNIYEFCLHLWAPLDHRPTPDFTLGLGAI